MRTQLRFNTARRRSRLVALALTGLLVTTAGITPTGSSSAEFDIQAIDQKILQAREIDDFDTCIALAVRAYPKVATVQQRRRMLLNAAACSNLNDDPLQAAAFFALLVRTMEEVTEEDWARLQRALVEAKQSPPLMARGTMTEQFRANRHYWHCVTTYAASVVDGHPYDKWGKALECFLEVIPEGYQRQYDEVQQFVYEQAMADLNSAKVRMDNQPPRDTAGRHEKPGTPQENPPSAPLSPYPPQGETYPSTGYPPSPDGGNPSDDLEPGPSTVPDEEYYPPEISPPMPPPAPLESFPGEPPSPEGPKGKYYPPAYPPVPEDIYPPEPEEYPPPDTESLPDESSAVGSESQRARMLQARIEEITSHKRGLLSITNVMRREHETKRKILKNLRD